MNMFLNKCLFNISTKEENFFPKRCYKQTQTRQECVEIQDSQGST